jgi:hypothetical protein
MGRHALRQSQVVRQSEHSPLVASKSEKERQPRPIKAGPMNAGPKSAALMPLRVICCCIACGAVATAAAQTDVPPSASEAAAMRRAMRAPSPPRRPPSLSETPRDEPPPQAAARRELPPLDTSVPPPSLPRAPRSRMRLCAMQWLKIREESRTRGVSWREFATKCLTR